MAGVKQRHLPIHGRIRGDPICLVSHKKQRLEKTISIVVAYKSIFLKGPSSVSNGVFYARCFNDYYGLYGEHCVSCWHFKQKTKYSKAVEDGKLKIYAAECSGEFTPGVGMAEPVAKRGLRFYLHLIVCICIIYMIILQI